MSRYLWLLLAVSCGGLQPAASTGQKPISSVSATDPRTQAEELGAKGIGVTSAAEAPKITTVIEKTKTYECHEITVHPAIAGSNRVLIRYMIAPDTWMLQRVRTNRNGSRTYFFRRLVQAPPSKSKKATSTNPNN